MNGTNWRDFVDSLHELEAYQKKVQKGYVKKRDQYTQTGPQKIGGGPFDQEPPKTRSKSAPPGFGAMGEEVEPESFDIHDSLEPSLWRQQELKESIARRLQKIAQDFIDGLPVEINIEDITLTGSLANYNWSEYSDVDLHIIVNYGEIDADRALVKAYFDNARIKWNMKHNIRVKGYDVEIYVEDSREQHLSSGVYSILKGEWIKKPRRYESSIDFIAARRKADDIEMQANMVRNIITMNKLGPAIKRIDRLKRKIKNMRAAGLQSPKQEFSTENIAFKILRRNGILDMIEDLKNEAYDQLHSVKEE